MLDTERLLEKKMLRRQGESRCGEKSDELIYAHPCCTYNPCSVIVEQACIHWVDSLAPPHACYTRYPSPRIPLRHRQHQHHHHDHHHNQPVSLLFPTPVAIFTTLDRCDSQPPQWTIQVLCQLASLKSEMRTNEKLWTISFAIIALDQH